MVTVRYSWFSFKYPLSGIVFLFTLLVLNRSPFFFVYSLFFLGLALKMVTSRFGIEPTPEEIEFFSPISSLYLKIVYNFPGKRWSFLSYWRARSESLLWCLRLVWGCWLLRFWWNHAPIQLLCGQLDLPMLLTRLYGLNWLVEPIEFFPNSRHSKPTSTLLCNLESIPFF